MHFFVLPKTVSITADGCSNRNADEQLETESIYTTYIHYTLFAIAYGSYSSDRGIDKPTSNIIISIVAKHQSANVRAITLSNNKNRPFFPSAVIHVRAQTHRYI